jgi:hypothetical protein
LPVLARNTSLSVPDAPITMMAAAPLVRVTPDHLSLVRGLILAGQTGRAFELLQAVWHPQEPEEHCWYLRVWIVTAEGRVLEALELSRVGVRELPGSAAVAYLQGVLEQVAGSPVAARDAASRASLIAPEHPLPAVLLAQLKAATGQEPDVGAPELSPGPSPLDLPTNAVPNPLVAAQLGAALLFPVGSGRALRPHPAQSGPVSRAVKPIAADRRRLGLVALAMAGATLLAIRYPVPAALGLALLVGWTLRPRQRLRDPGPKALH